MGEQVGTFNSQYAIRQGLGPYDLDEIVEECCKNATYSANRALIARYVKKSGEMLDHVLSLIPEGSTILDPDQLNFQEFAYPENYDKLRFMENHDQPRIASLVPAASDLENYTAMLYFLKGTTLLYAGQEAACDHLPGLFDRDPVSWDTGTDLTPLMQKLCGIKKDILSPEDSFFAEADDEHHIAVMTRDNGSVRKLGVFSLRSQAARVCVDAPDGDYVNLLDGETVRVREGMLETAGRPIILAFPV